MGKVNVGIIGTGNISNIYITNLKKFTNINLVGVSDILIDKAKEKAEEHELKKIFTVDEMLKSKDIDLIVNLTIPNVHVKVGLDVLNSGKHVYGEKPLGINTKEAKTLIETAKEKNLLVGSAPDTVLGAGIQTCKKLINDGWIGDIIGTSAFVINHGMESWHPNPDFFFKPGAEPLFDMGPYYLTSLINLIGPIESVQANNKISFKERTITSQEHFGEKIKVETPTYITSLLNFKQGATGTIIFTNDVWGSNLPRIEIYGTEGTLMVPDPNSFGGPIKIKRAGYLDWQEIPLSHFFSENSRGLGVSDMANVILGKQEKFRANGDIAFHVLDTMESILKAGEEKKLITLNSTCEVPEPMPMTYEYNGLDTYGVLMKESRDAIERNKK